MRRRGEEKREGVRGKEGKKKGERCKEGVGKRNVREKRCEK